MFKDQWPNIKSILFLILFVVIMGGVMYAAGYGISKTESYQPIYNSLNNDRRVSRPSGQWPM